MSSSGSFFQPVSSPRFISVSITGGGICTSGVSISIDG